LFGIFIKGGMMMTPIEKIALVFIVLAAVKMLILLVKPMAWMNGTMKTFSNKIFTQFVGLVIAGIVFYYLRQGGMSIVQILAVSAFVSALMMIAFAGHINDFAAKYKGLIKRGKLWQEYWLYTLIWLILMGWGVKELFF
jgi:FtsH-binding integral membrane protein